MNVTPGVNQIFSAGFEHLFRDGTRVKLMSASFQDVVDWSMEVQTQRLNFLKTYQEFIPSENRARVVMAAATGAVTDAMGSLIGTIEGKRFLLSSSLRRANPVSFPIDDTLNHIFSMGIDDVLSAVREIAGRGGMLAPKSEEESERWGRPIPPMSDQDSVLI